VPRGATGYVVVELKTGKFQLEYGGKLQLYIVLVDDKLRPCPFP
jgi:hypothetical protein